MVHFIPGVYQVPQNHAVVIERSGRFQKVLSPGFNFVNPLLSRHKNLSDWQGVASKCNYLMELTEQQLETQIGHCQTKDNVAVNANAIIYFKITEPEKAAYHVDVLPEAIQKVCLNILRSKISTFSFDEIFSKRSEINKVVVQELEKKVSPWGIHLSDVEIGKLAYDKAIYAAMQKKRIAETEGQSQICKADAIAQAGIKQAEGELRKGQILSMLKKNEAETNAKIREIQAQAKSNADRMENETEIRNIEQLAEQVGTRLAMQLIQTKTIIKGLKDLAENTGLSILPPHAVNSLSNLIR